MGGITGTGLISGIDTASLVNQLIQASSRPRDLASQRLFQLQTQQAAFLDINSRMSALRSASAAFRTDNLFDAKRASTSDAEIITATASGNAQPGSYDLIVDRLVSTQQMLTRGFQDRDVTAFGAERFTIESERARLDRDTALADLNDGQGIERGNLVITSATGTTTVDLSRVATVSEVLEAINTSGAGVTARVQDGAFVVDNATAIASGSGSNTAESLGLDTTINGTTDADGVTGASVYGLSSDTALSVLNDGNGVSISTVFGVSTPDFQIRVNNGSGDTVLGIELGEIIGPDPDFTAPSDDPGATAPDIAIEAAVSTVGGVVERINTALSDAGFAGVTASVDTATGAIAFDVADGTDISIEELAGRTTARDLGIRGLATDSTPGDQTLAGERVLAGLNSVLLRNLAGGANDSPIPGSGELNITLSDGSSFSLNLNNRTITLPPTAAWPIADEISIDGQPGFDGPITTANELLEAFENLPDAIDYAITQAQDPAGQAGLAGLQFSVGLNNTGTGFEFNDRSGGTGNLIITGADGDDTAAALGISTGAAGTSESSVGGSAQLRYISEATRLDDLRGGRGVGTGRFQIIGASGESATIDIGDDSQTLQDIIREINSRGDELQVRARINDNGDGLLIESTATAGGQRIEISDESGSVAARLGISGTAENNSDGNFLDGSLEKVIEFDPTDTLNDALQKINDAGGGVRATVLNDGSPNAPFRISLSATESGTAGRFVLDTGGFDLGLSTLDEGNDARVFFGSDDPAKAVLITSSTNELSDVIDGVDIDLLTESEDTVTVTVADDTARVESQIEAFVAAFNGVLDRINQQTRFVEETGERGALLGDTTVLGLQNALANTANGTSFGFSSTFDRLVDVGITVGDGGRLEFDSADFRDALAADPDAVEDLFTRRTLVGTSGQTVIPGEPIIDPATGEQATDDEGNPLFTPEIEIRDANATDEFSELGIMVRFEELADRYIDSLDGVLTLRNRALDTQIDNQNARIDSLNDGLDRQRARLEAQFVAMEQAIASLQGQQSALAGLTGLF